MRLPARVNRGVDSPDDVLVLDARDVPQVFARRADVLGPDAVEAVCEAARWEGTWTR